MKSVAAARTRSVRHGTAHASGKELHADPAAAAQTATISTIGPKTVSSWGRTRDVNVNEPVAWSATVNALRAEGNVDQTAVARTARTQPRRREFLAYDFCANCYVYTLIMPILSEESSVDWCLLRAIALLLYVASTLVIVPAGFSRAQSNLVWKKENMQFPWRQPTWTHFSFLFLWVSLIH